MSFTQQNAKHTFCEFEQEPGVYCSKAAIFFSYCSMNLKAERNMMRLKREVNECGLFSQYSFSEFVFVFRFYNEPFNTHSLGG